MHRFWYENGTGTMVFDFNAPISGYGLVRLQTAVAALVGVPGSRTTTGNVRVAIRGRWQNARKARTIDPNA
jgi:hypothetical protein